MPKTERTLPIVRVQWVDAQVNGEGWMDPLTLQEWLDEPAIMTSIGILLRRNKQWVVIAMSIGDECVADCIKIPAGMLKKVEIIGHTPFDGFQPKTKKKRGGQHAQ